MAGQDGRRRQGDKQNTQAQGSMSSSRNHRRVAAAAAAAWAKAAPAAASAPASGISCARSSSSLLFAWGWWAKGDGCAHTQGESACAVLCSAAVARDSVRPDWAHLTCLVSELLSAYSGSSHQHLFPQGRIGFLVATCGMYEHDMSTCVPLVQLCVIVFGVSSFSWYA